MVYHLSENDEDLDPKEINALCEKICRLMHGHGPYVQGAVLGELVARYLAGFHIFNTPDQDPHMLRRRILRAHVRLVLKLIPLHERELLRSRS